jgi:hypothetical protein
MKSLIFSLFLILFFCTSAYSQSQYEYGKTSEIKGLTKVFVDSGLDTENRNRIIKVLKKAKLNLEILDSSDEAEVILMFRAEKKQEIGTTGGGKVYTDEILIGKGCVNK